MSNELNATTQQILDSLGDGVLIFDMDGKLLFDNAVARQILGADLVVMRTEGWSACAMIIDAGKSEEDVTAEEIRAKALRQTEPVRFNILMANAYTPGWASTIHGEADKNYLMVCLEQPDWAPLMELMQTFRSEAGMAIGRTKGHADLIIRIANKRPDTMNADQLAQRVLGFSQLMSEDMYRLQNLLVQLHRLEIIRTGQLKDSVTQAKKKLNLQMFIEDFLEDIAEQPLTERPMDGDLRDRIDIDIPSGMYINVSKNYFEHIVRDILRNAVMYSENGTLIKFRAQSLQGGAQILFEVEDLGYGIRGKESDRVFKPFQRARQPQIIAEFGYGLSMYLAKANIEAMGGKIWFDSEEGVGTTFKIQLAAHKDES